MMESKPSVILAESVLTSSPRTRAMSEPRKIAHARFWRRFGTLIFSNQIMDLSFLIFFVVFLGMGLIRFFWALWQVMA
jgi:hypothetical protein